MPADIIDGKAIAKLVDTLIFWGSETDYAQSFF